MRNVVRLAQLALVSGFALVGTAIPSLAAAAGNLDAHLRGSYAFSTTRTCTISPLPYVGDTFALPILPPGFSFSRQTNSDSGIITFNGDGTGTSTGRASGLNITSTGGPILFLSDFTTTFNYTANPDGTVDTTSTSGNFETVFGAGLGTTGTSSGQVGRLQISHGNTMLVSAPAERVAVETLVFTPPTGPQFTQYRLCVRSITATMLPGK